MDSGKRKRDRKGKRLEMRVASQVETDEKATRKEVENKTEEKVVWKEEENRTDETEANEEVEEEVEVMREEDQADEEDEAYDPWSNNKEESDRERASDDDVEIARCKRLFRYGDDSSDASSGYDSDNYALSSWKD